MLKHMIYMSGRSVLRNFPYPIILEEGYLLVEQIEV